jgi:hypothetical protein
MGNSVLNGDRVTVHILVYNCLLYAANSPLTYCRLILNVHIPEHQEGPIGRRFWHLITELRTDLSII